MNNISTMKARFAKIREKAWIGAKVRLFFSFFLVASAVGLAFAPSQASAETRSLKLYYLHTGEKAEIAFKRDGRYLPDGLKRLNVFLRDWRRNEPTKMDPRLFDLVWQVYQSTGSREYINVVSAYRSPATNAMLRSRTKGVAKKSQHMLGHAMDYFIPGVPLAKLRATGMRFQIGGVGYYPRSGSPFVHMDVGNVRAWPRMSRRELLALFPNGNTAHIPADGKPLPGYEQAVAMVQKRKADGGDILMASNSPRKSKSLFGALFGGGADEEEDEGESAAPATARPARAAPVRQAPAVEPPAVTPEAPVQQSRETMIAALPPRDAPVPMQAPRPETGLPGTVANAQTLDAQAQGAGETAAPQVPATVAFNVPVPARRPEMTPQDAVALAAADPQAEGQMAAASPLLNGFVPIPAMRPGETPDQANGDTQLAAVAIPSQRPQRPGEAASGQDAIAALVDASGNGGDVATSQPTDTQLAMVSKRDEIGDLIAPPSEDDDAVPAVTVEPKPAPVKTASLAPVVTAKPAEVRAVVGKSVDTGVRTTAKGARRVASAAVKPRAVVQPVDAHSTELARSRESMAQTVPATNPVLRNDAMREAPAMVYTAGFQRGDIPGDRANKFSGKAVTFLTVAKFSETN